MHWYKRDPNAAIVGMTTLTLEECGAYNLILDHIYANDGELAFDDAAISRLLHVHQSTWRKLKAALIAKGKIWQKDGKVVAKRVEKTLKESREFSQKQSDAANKRWHKSENNSENNGTMMPPAIPAGNAPTTTTTTTTTTTNKIVSLEFEKLKKAYPKRKGGQGWTEAEKYFLRAIKEGCDAASLILAATKFAKSIESAVGTEYVPMAVKWMRNRLYLEFLPTPEDLAKEARIAEIMRGHGKQWVEGKGWIAIENTS